MEFWKDVRITRFQRSLSPGEVNERSNKNTNIPTGEIEIIVSELNVLNSALTPPFTIEDNSDGGEDVYKRQCSYILLFIDSNSGISLMDRQYLRAWYSAKPA